MQKKTRSILEELESLYVERDQRLLIENRAANVIANAIRLVEQIEAAYDFLNKVFDKHQRTVLYNPTTA